MEREVMVTMSGRIINLTTNNLSVHRHTGTLSTSRSLELDLHCHFAAALRCDPGAVQAAGGGEAAEEAGRQRHSDLLGGIDGGL